MGTVRGLLRLVRKELSADEYTRVTRFKSKQLAACGPVGTGLGSVPAFCFSRVSRTQPSAVLPFKTRSR